VLHYRGAQNARMVEILTWGVGLERMLWDEGSKAGGVPVKVTRAGTATRVTSNLETTGITGSGSRREQHVLRPFAHAPKLNWG